MADDKTMYVWSPIVTPAKVFKLGEMVTKSDIGDDWDYLVEAGSVRSTKYPTHESGEVISKSPTQHLQDQVAAMSTGAYVPDVVSTSDTPEVTKVENK